MKALPDRECDASWFDKLTMKRTPGVNLRSIGVMGSRAPVAVAAGGGERGLPHGVVVEAALRQAGLAVHDTVPAQGHETDALAQARLEAHAAARTDIEAHAERLG